MTSEIKQLTEPFLDSVSTLFEEYLEKFPDERSKFSILRRQLEARDKQLCCRKNLAGHLTASGLLLNPKGDAVFLIYHNFLKMWLQPGGHLDPEESPVKGALREFLEETGINHASLHAWHRTNPIPFDMDTHAIPPNEKKNEGSHYHHDFQFLLSLSNDKEESSENSINIAEDEVSHYRWVTLTELSEGDHDKRLKRVAEKIKLNLKQERS